MSRMSGPSAVLVTALLCALLPATTHASRRISSDPAVPDTGRVAAASTDLVPMVTLPVWIGVDSEFALYRSKWESMPRVGPRGRFGVTLYVPLQKEGVRNWTSIGYEEDELETRAYMDWFNGSNYTLVPVSVQSPTTLFTLRSGLDHVAGSEQRPRAFLGAGLGVGYGLIASPLAGRSERWGVFDTAVRGGLYAYPSANSRIGLVGQGLLGFRLAVHDLRDAYVELRLGLSFESALQLPKRFVESR